MDQTQEKHAVRGNLGIASLYPLLLIIPITLIARVFSLISMHSHNWYMHIEFYDLAADFWSIVFVWGCLNIIAILEPLAKKLSIVLQGIFMMIVSFVYISTRKYYHVYKTEFDWSHMGHEQVEAGLIHSIQAELDIWVASALITCFILCLLWIICNLRLEKGSIRHGWKVYALLNLVAMGGLVLYLYSSKNIKHFKSRDYQEGNVVLNLWLYPIFPTSNHANPPPLELLPEEVPNFSYHFPSNSLSSNKIKKPLPIPFRGQKLNIVFYFMESFAHKYANKTDPKGTPITPWLDQMSQNAIVFHKHYVNNPLSINALFNIMTSAYSFPADRWVARDYPDIALPSLPQLLKEKGYRNAVFHTGYFAYAGAGRFLKNRGFDLLQDFKDFNHSKFKIVNWGIDDRAYIQPSLEFAQKKTGEPFFITYLPVSPHHPYETPNDQYPISIPEAFANKGQSFRKYLNSLNYSDYVLHQTIQAYEKAGLMENTVFFIFADHGEAFGQHRQNYNHPFFIYEENVHVPFIIYSPHLIRERIDVFSISRHIDIMPTVLDMLGMVPPEHIEGKSLLISYPEQFAAFYTSWRNHLLGIRDGDYKYIYNEKTRKEELYNLSLDPAEKDNIYVQNKELAHKFKMTLMRLRIHQKQFFEKTIGKKIDWNRLQDKEKF